MKNVVDVQHPKIREMDKNELKRVNGGDAADTFLAVCVAAGFVMVGVGLIATGPAGIAFGITGGSMGYATSVAGVIKAFVYKQQ